MNYEKQLLTTKMEVFDKNIVFMAEDMGQLCHVKWDENGYDLKVLMLPPNDNVYRSIFKQDNYIYVFPQGRGDVIIYDLESGQCLIKCIPRNLHNAGEGNWSAGIYAFQNSVYFAWDNPVITKYLWKEEKWVVYREWKKKLSKECAEYKTWFMWNTFTFGKEVFFNIWNSNMFLSINDETEEIKMHLMEFPGNLQNEKIMLVRFDGKYIWLQTLNEEKSIGIYRGCINDFKAEKIIDIPITKRIGRVYPYFLVMEIEGNKLYLLPAEYDKAYIVDVEERVFRELPEITVVSMKEMSMKRSKRYINYFHGERKGNYLYSFNIITGSLAIIDLITSECKTILPKMNKVRMMEEMPEYAMQEGAVMELHEFLEYVKNKEK